jgi:hypothetical protein
MKSTPVKFCEARNCNCKLFKPVCTIVVLIRELAVMLLVCVMTQGLRPCSKPGLMKLDIILGAALDADEIEEIIEVEDEAGVKLLDEPMLDESNEIIEVIDEAGVEMLDDPTLDEKRLDESVLLTTLLGATLLGRVELGTFNVELNALDERILETYKLLEGGKLGVFEELDADVLDISGDAEMTLENDEIWLEADDKRTSLEEGEEAALEDEEVSLKDDEGVPLKDAEVMSLEEDDDDGE